LYRTRFRLVMATYMFAGGHGCSYFSIYTNTNRLQLEWLYGWVGIPC